MLARVYPQDGSEEAFVSYLFRVQIIQAGARHVLSQTHHGKALGNGRQNDILQLVFGVARTELPGVGMHGESHLELVCVAGRLFLLLNRL